MAKRINACTAEFSPAWATAMPLFGPSIITNNLSSGR